MRFNHQVSDQSIPIVTGPATQPYTVNYTAGDTWLGIRFRPQNAAVLWQRRIESAADTVLRGEDALTLVPELGDVRDGVVTMDNLLQSLERQAPCPAESRLSHALDVLHVSGGRIRIDKLAQLVGCTTRQLNREFNKNIGLSTKTYTQLVKFHRTLKLVHAERLSISDAAFEGGYSDHAHLTRTFQRFGGFSPSKIPQNLALPTLLS